MSEATVRRHTYEVGKAALAVQNTQESQPTEAEPTGKLVVSPDGAMVSLLKGVWAEVKTVVVGEVEPAKSGESVHSTKLSYFSRMLEVERFTEQATGELQRRGVDQASEVCAVMDGAEWIDGFLDWQCPDAVRILDFAHAAEYVSAIGQLAGAFREDLFYRLNVFTLAVPPLRQRVEDIPLLVTAFIEEFNGTYDKRITGVDDATLKILMSHAWPGNVRELRNVVERAFVSCHGAPITLTILPGTPIAAVTARGVDPDAFTVPVGLPLREVEKQFVLRTLAAEHNNKSRAADRLEISAKTLHNMLRRWGLLHRSLD